VSDLAEAKVVRDLLPIGMEHVLVAVQDRFVVDALALFDDLRERMLGGAQVADGDDPPAAAVVEDVVTCLAGSPQNSAGSPSWALRRSSASSIAS